ncbi:MAG: hypothetical protein ACWGO1_12720, partial [Anaerolineales bacterium]
WLENFLKGVQAYNGYLQPNPVVHLPGVSGWVLLVISGLISLWLFGRNLSSAPGSVSFAGCLVWSLGVWWLFVPVLGMMHLVALPLALMLLLAGLNSLASRLYRYGVVIACVLYGLGLLGFLYGLSPAGFYDLHILLAELAYKLAAPISLLLLAMPLCLGERDLLLD